MTKLEFINKFFFQWFFIRLARNEVVLLDDITITEVSMVEHRAASIGFDVNASHKEQWYSFIGWIVPTTGWSNDYKIIGGKKYWNKRLTKNKVKNEKNT